MAVGRDTRRWRKLKEEFKGLSANSRASCWLCGQVIDYKLSSDHPESFAPDHFYPVSTHPQYAEDKANLRASHSHCNKSRGNRAPQLGLGRQTRQW